MSLADGAADEAVYLRNSCTRVSLPDMVSIVTSKLDPLSFADYQKFAMTTAVFPHHIPDELAGVVYCALGLAGEAGEIAGKVKKLIRDGDTPEKRVKIKTEAGDLLWYIPELLHELGEFTLEQCARDNMEKLTGRRERGTIHGDGDDR